MFIPFGFFDSPASTSSIATSGLILNYDISNTSSYPGSGTTVTDLTGSSNATLYNSPTYTATGGGYLTFNGSNQYLGTNTALGSKLNPANSSTVISIFVWVYPIDNGVIVSELGSTSPNTGWHDSQIEMVGGTLRFSVWQNQPGFASSISRNSSQYQIWRNASIQHSIKRSRCTSKLQRSKI